MANIEATILADMLRDSLRQGQSPRLTVSSNSMAPLLRQGDQITLEAVAPDKLVIGDIITVGSMSEVMTHRFWGMTDESGQRCLLTRGDRPLVFDKPWPVEALIGRVNGRFQRNHHLNLVTGPGRWLNRRLHRLAQRETGLWGKSPRRSWRQRGLRALFYGWARLLTGLVVLISRYFGESKS
jgi:signal peptidase I